MSEYRLFETQQFDQDLWTLVRSQGQPALDALEKVVRPQLRQAPRLGPAIEKLSDYTPETWRCRVGPWGFFYEIDDEERIVFLTAAACHTGPAY